MNRKNILIAVLMSLTVSTIAVGCGDGKKGGKRTGLNKTLGNKGQNGGDGGSSSGGGNLGGGTEQTAQVNSINEILKTFESGQAVLVDALAEGEYVLTSVATHVHATEKGNDVHAVREQSAELVVSNKSASSKLVTDFDSGRHIELEPKFTIVKDQKLTRSENARVLSTKLTAAGLEDAYVKDVTDALSVVDAINAAKLTDKSYQTADGKGAITIRKQDQSIIVEIAILEKNDETGKEDISYLRRRIFLTYSAPASETAPEGAQE
ncbi:MAG TPA: hypothetical protein PKC28_01710 [Bdellovibrionales bacterium]|nr:hypothetical protein [Bdellovibrionales bacterium]